VAKSVIHFPFTPFSKNSSDLRESRDPTRPGRVGTGHVPTRGYTLLVIFNAMLSGYGRAWLRCCAGLSVLARNPDEITGDEARGTSVEQCVYGSTVPCRQHDVQ